MLLKYLYRYGKDGLFYYTVGDRYLGQWRFGVQQGVGTLFRCNIQ